MGISRGGARLLLTEAAARPFSGSVLQLGRQDIHFGRQALTDWAAQQWRRPSPLEKVGVSVR